jgi:hypothetical protein
LLVISLDSLLSFGRFVISMLASLIGLRGRSFFSLIF